jgi:hypothetical protein
VPTALHRFEFARSILTPPGLPGVSEILIIRLREMGDVVLTSGVPAARCTISGWICGSA